MELYEQCEGKIDYLVCGAGTGGTITGTAKILKVFLIIISYSFILIYFRPQNYSTRINLIKYNI